MTNYKLRPGTKCYTGLEKPTEKEFKEALIGLFNPHIRHDYMEGWIILCSDKFSERGEFIEHKMWWLHSGMRDNKNYTRIPRMDKLCEKYRRWIKDMRHERMVIGELEKWQK